jgi:hypothetical protein
LVVQRVSALGRTAGILAVGILAGYILLKYLRRWLFLRQLRIARISAEELKRKLDAGEDIAIIDLRTALDVVATPNRWIAAEALDQHFTEIPRDRELIVYCS